MTLDREVLAEKVAVVNRHLDRVRDRLPESPALLTPMSDASDAVILHLWQAVQIVIDVAVTACVKLGLGSPATYAEAFRKLAEAGRIDHPLADRLARAAGFRNIVAHAYEHLDMQRIHEAAARGPVNLRAFLAAMSLLAA